jgi:hypothetical protein
MSEVQKSFVLALMTGLALSGCTKKEEQPMIPAIFSCNAGQNFPKE